MTEQEMWEAMLGLYAYDTGAVDSGIHDEGLRERVKAKMAEMGAWNDSPARFEPCLARWIRVSFLSEQALAVGYGVEDVKAFFDWLSRRMEYDI